MSLSTGDLKDIRFEVREGNVYLLARIEPEAYEGLRLQVATRTMELLAERMAAEVFERMRAKLEAEVVGITEQPHHFPRRHMEWGRR